MYPVNQGPPSEHVALNVLDSHAARKYELELLDASDTAAAWDAKADARRAAWEASPFARAVSRLITLERKPS